MKLNIFYRIVCKRRRKAYDVGDDLNYISLQSRIKAEKKNGVK